MIRSQELSKWRPQLSITVDALSSEVEKFMHITLRPILKFQNEVILLLIKNSVHFSSIKWLQENTPENHERNRVLLDQFIGKNTTLKNQLIGSILGLMKSHELEFYFEYEKELKKRIIDLCVTRFHSQYKA